MNYTQMHSSLPPPLRKVQSSPTVAAAASVPPPPPLPDVVATIQHANARLAASASAAAARSRSRDNQRDHASLIDSSSNTVHSSQAIPSVNNDAAGVLRRPANTASASPARDGSTSSPRSPSPADSTHTAAPPPPTLNQSITKADIVSRSIPPPPATAAAAAASPSSWRGGSDSEAALSLVKDELHRTREQLHELQRLYSYEKRAHLQQRTRQLRDEAAQRHSDEGIVEQTAQLLTEYEELIRFRDVASAEHLQSVMEHVTQHWQRSADALEQTRERCVVSVLAELTALSTRQREALQATMQEQLMKVARKGVEAEAAQLQVIADAVQEQVEVFKNEYRSLLEQDMQERQRLMDAQVSRREEQWLSFLKDEHARMIAAGEAASRESSRRQLETLHLALRDISELRTQLAEASAQRQAEVATEYVASYESLAQEYAVAAHDAAEYAHRIQRDCATMLSALQSELNGALDAKATAERAAQLAEVHAQESALQQQQAMRADMEAQWQRRLRDERGAHSAALARLTAAHDAEVQRIQEASQQREAALVAQHEAEVRRLHDDASRYRESRAQNAAEAHDELRRALHAAQEKSEAVQQRTQELHEQLLSERAAHEVKQSQLRQELETAFAAQLAALQERYEAALQQHTERLRRTDEDGAGRSENAAAVSSTHALLRRVADLEDELTQLQQRHASQLQETTDGVVELWSTRLKTAQQHWEEERDALLRQHRSLRQTLLAEVKERESAVEARRAALQQTHEQELQETRALEKEEARRSIERLRSEHAMALAQREAEMLRTVQLREEALAEREARCGEAERRAQQRLAEDTEALRRELLEQAAAQCREHDSALAQREQQLSEAQVDLARQLLRSTQDIRASVQQEEAARVDHHLREAQQQWQALSLRAMQDRYSAWQESRMAELTTLTALHREETTALRQHYEQQLRTVQEAQTQQLRDHQDELAAQEAAWCAARTASLQNYERDAADRLRAVLMEEKVQWEAQVTQRARTAQADVDSVVKAAEEALRANEDDRQRAADELRETYMAVVMEHETRAAQQLAEVRRQHEEEKARLSRDFTQQLRQQATAIEAAYAQHAAREAEATRQLRAEHEEEMAALRADHASLLVEEREAAEAQRRRAHQQASDAQRETEKKMEAMHRAEVKQLENEAAELRSRCAEQAAHIRRQEAELCATEQRTRDALQAQFRDEYESSMADLRHALEARNQSFASLQASLYTQVQQEAQRLQHKMDAAYAAFTEEQQGKLREQAAAHEAALMDQQRTHQQRVAQLQQQHEAALTAQAATLRAAHEDARVKLAAAYAAQEAEWKQLLEKERAAHAAADDRVHALTAELAAQEVAHAQQQADALTQLDAHYHHLLDDARAQVREEREEAARRSLEEAEHRFLSELPFTRRSSLPSASPVYPLKGASTPSAVPFRRDTCMSRRSGGNSSSVAAAAAAAANENHELVGEEAVAPVWPGTKAWATSPLLSPPAHRATPLHRGSPQPLSPTAPREFGHQSPPRLPPTDSAPGTPYDTQRLQQLWDVLEVPLQERYTFMDAIDAMAHDPAAQHRAWLQEQRRLEAQLPLLEAVTRREYVQRQLRTLLRRRPQQQPLSARGVNAASAAAAAAGVGNTKIKKKKEGENDSSPAPPPHPISPNTDSAPLDNEALPAAVAVAESRHGAEYDATTYERLEEELSRLTAQLRRDIALHESQFGQLFCYNGSRVMEALGTS